MHAYCTCIGFNGSSHSELCFIAIRLDPVVISLTPIVATLKRDTVQVGGNGINLHSLRPGLVKGLELRGQKAGGIWGGRGGGRGGGRMRGQSRSVQECSMRHVPPHFGRHLEPAFCAIQHIFNN